MVIGTQQNIGAASGVHVFSTRAVGVTYREERVQLGARQAGGQLLELTTVMGRHAVCSRQQLLAAVNKLLLSPRGFLTIIVLAAAGSSSSWQQQQLAAVASLVVTEGLLSMTV